MFVSTSEFSRSSHGHSVLYWAKPARSRKYKQITAPHLARNAPRRPKAVPSCENRATQAALHKNTQRGLLAYKYTNPVPVESSRGYKLGNRVQPGVAAGAGYTYQPETLAATR